MKKFLLGIISCLLVMSFNVVIFANANNSAETKSMSLIVNGDEVKCIKPPVVENGELMLPIREVFEVLGAKVGWNNKTKSITVDVGKTSIKVNIGSKTAIINGNSKTLKAATKMIGPKTFVHSQLITLCFSDKEIKWNKEKNKVSIEKKKDVQPTPSQSTETPVPSPTQITPLVSNTPFEVNSVNAKSELTVEISFNHQLNKESAESVRNYTIQAFGDSGKILPISKAELDATCTKVLLTTSEPQAASTVYNLTVKSVQDIYNNEIINFKQSFGSLVLVGRKYDIDLSATTTTSIELVYKVKLDKASAEDISNYYLLNPSEDPQRTVKIPIAKAELDSTGMRLKITFASPLETMNIYEVVMQNIATIEGTTLAKEVCAFVVLPEK